MRINSISNTFVQNHLNNTKHTVSTNNFSSESSLQNSTDLRDLNFAKSYCKINFKSNKANISLLPVPIKQLKHVPNGWVGVYNKDDLKKALYQNKNVILMKDISFDENEKWIPVGDRRSPFNGKLNGNGHSIFNLKIDSNHTFYNGLIGYAQNAEVKNLVLDDVKIDAKTNTFDTGAIAGMLTESLVENCFVSGRIKGSKSTGGITGNNTYNSVIKNCEVLADISADEIVGGIAGYNSINSEINDCLYSGAVIGRDSKAGGIVGLNLLRAFVNNCTSQCHIFCDDTFGGLAGMNTDYSSITDCSTTYVIGKNASATGGVFVGVNSMDSHVKNNKALPESRNPSSVELIGVHS